MMRRMEGGQGSGRRIKRFPSFLVSFEREHLVVFDETGEESRHCVSIWHSTSTLKRPNCMHKFWKKSTKMTTAASSNMPVTVAVVGCGQRGKAGVVAIHLV
jgi:hypothetical protein